MGDSDSVAASADDLAATASALAATPTTVAIATPAAAAQDSSATPSNTVAIATTSSDSTRTAATLAAPAVKASPALPVSVGASPRTGTAAKLGPARHATASAGRLPTAAVAGWPATAGKAVPTASAGVFSPASVQAAPQAQAGAALLNEPPVVRPAEAAGRTAVQDATLAAFSTWLPAAEPGEIQPDSPVGDLRPAGQAKASRTTLIDLALQAGNKKPSVSSFVSGS